MNSKPAILYFGTAEGDTREMAMRDGEKGFLPVGQDAPTNSRGKVSWDVLQLTQEHVFAIIAHHAYVDAGVRTTKAAEDQPSMLQAFIHCLQEQSLLRIDGLGFHGLDAEELSIEQSNVFIYHIGMSNIGPAVMGTIRVKKSFGAESLAKHFPTNVSRLT